MIEVRNISKRFGTTTAVDDLTFTAPGGVVTGFLGPNGAGKTTTMRMVLGLDRPTTGRATVDGRPLVEHPAPLRSVGAVLDAGSAAPGMTARAHLRWIARAGAIPDRRVDECLDRVGLTAVAGRRVRALSLGMRQRLGLATALLGDPGTLVLDEPVNGLDPEGVRWMRTLLTGLAGEGRAVLVSSHLMAEMELTADTVVVIGRGRLVADLPMDQLRSTAHRGPVRVRAADPDRLLDALRRAGVPAEVQRLDPDPGAGAPAPGTSGAVLRLSGPTPEQIGDAAAGAATPVYELTPERASLEDVFMQLTRDAAEHTATPHRTEAIR